MFHTLSAVPTGPRPLHGSCPPQGSSRLSPSPAAWGWGIGAESEQKSAGPHTQGRVLSPWCVQDRREDGGAGEGARPVEALVPAGSDGAAARATVVRGGGHGWDGEAVGGGLVWPWAVRVPFTGGVQALEEAPPSDMACVTAPLACLPGQAGDPVLGSAPGKRLPCRWF